MKKEQMIKCKGHNKLYPYSENQFICDKCMKKAVLGLADIIHSDKKEIERLMKDFVDATLTD
ncbi:MAG: hypothetical protein DRP06_03750 [Candidatus Aenigmatarchaeota archaeon]|nr:MAG: hypothetical protein DRP06_03750 [Candidatus Aenigmarchaeota archaeon]